MPAVNFTIRWPDGKQEVCYSPSTVIHEYFKSGDSMPVAEFMSRAETALTKASERVESRFGYFCSSASDQLQKLRETAPSYAANAEPVEILALAEIAAAPLP